MGIEQRVYSLDSIETRDYIKCQAVWAVSIDAPGVEGESISNIDLKPCPSTSIADAMPSNVPQRPRRFLRPSINIGLVRKQESTLADASKIAECRRLTEQFESLVKLGEGTSAVVYRAIDRREKRDVALKVSRTDEEERLQNAQDEFNLLQQIKHPNIIKALDFFTYVRGTVMVQEFFNGENLETTLMQTGDGCMAEGSARLLFIKLLDAVAYLHKQGIIHRDIKAQNVLISRSMLDLRLVDFNSSTRVADGASLTMVGTRQYMPPEVLQGNSPSEASDVWASGLCLHYMLIGNLPSKEDGIHIQLEGSKWEQLSEPCQLVVRRCLEHRQSLRPTASEVTTDSWLQLTS
mmetsp:Transcript_4646/g.7544  ORF Transcript_4646/g.7544 Transcript_4646/m.7544 type:complete len:349 (+) Transcript_4646:55-1101(+)